MEINVLSTDSVFEVAGLKFSKNLMFNRCAFVLRNCSSLAQTADCIYIDNSIVLCIIHVLKWCNSCMMFFFSQCVFLRSSTDIFDVYQCFHLLCTNTYCILSIL